MNLLEYNSVFYKMVKAVFNVAEFTKLMLHNCIKVVRLKPDQPNQWLRACLLWHLGFPLYGPWMRAVPCVIIL